MVNFFTKKCVYTIEYIYIIKLHSFDPPEHAYLFQTAGAIDECYNKINDNVFTFHFSCFVFSPIYEKFRTNGDL